MNLKERMGFNIQILWIHNTKKISFLRCRRFISRANQSCPVLLGLNPVPIQLQNLYYKLLLLTSSLYLIYQSDSHAYGLRILITLMRIPIQLFALMRIRILLLIKLHKVMRICNQWSIDHLGLYVEPLGLHCELFPRPSMGFFWGYKTSEFCH